MAGNSALFKIANQLMREGYSRKQAFAAAYSEMGEPRKAKRKPAVKTAKKKTRYRVAGPGKRRMDTRTR